MTISIWQTLAICGLGAMLTAGGAGAAEELKVGDKAPDWSLPGSDGKTYKLSQFQGKKGVVIAWFPKAFTGGCTKECKSLRQATKELKPLKVAYFTASVDTAELNKKFAESLELDYPILSDPEQTTAKAYGVMQSQRPVAARWTFYIDKDGIVRAIDKTIRTEPAGPDMAAKVKELGLVGE